MDERNSSQPKDRTGHRSGSVAREMEIGKAMDKPFVYLNGILVNLHQIAWVGDATEETLGLHLSDGKTLIIEGRSAVEGLVELLSRISMVPDGTPLKTALALGKKLPVAEIRETVSQ
jgi:hypothetical protein